MSYILQIEKKHIVSCTLISFFLPQCRAAAQTCRRKPRHRPGLVRSSPSSGTTLWPWWFCARSRTTLMYGHLEQWREFPQNGNAPSSTSAPGRWAGEGVSWEFLLCHSKQHVGIVFALLQGVDALRLPLWPGLQKHGLSPQDAWAKKEGTRWGIIEPEVTIMILRKSSLER